jgi:hypothetical protein
LLLALCCLCLAFVFVFASLVVIPEVPALSEAEWGICFPETPAISAKHGRDTTSSSPEESASSAAKAKGSILL